MCLNAVALGVIGGVSRDSGQRREKKREEERRREKRARKERNIITLSYRSCWHHLASAIKRQTLSYRPPMEVSLAGDKGDPTASLFLQHPQHPHPSILISTSLLLSSQNVKLKNCKNCPRIWCN